jgi:hypothetical protein
MSEQEEDTRAPSAGWDAAIDFARAELDAANRRVRQLRKAIRLLVQNRDDGVEWPSPPADAPQEKV